MTRRAAPVFGATDVIAGAPEALAGGGDLYARFARNGHAAFREEVTEEAMRARFLDFLGIAAAGKA